MDKSPSISTTFKEKRQGDVKARAGVHRPIQRATQQILFSLPLSPAGTSLGSDRVGQEIDPSQFHRQE